MKSFLFTLVIFLTIAARKWQAKSEVIFRPAPVESIKTMPDWKQTVYQDHLASGYYFLRSEKETGKELEPAHWMK